jgi:cytochrome P450
MTTREAPATEPSLTITHDGPGGCPVLHGFEPLEPAQIADPVAVTEFSRREVPVFFSPALGAYIVTSYTHAVKVITDWKAFGRAPFIDREMPEEVRELLPEGFVTAAITSWNDPQNHTRLRKLAQVPFVRQNARDSAELCRRVSDETIEEFRSAGEADLIPAFARKVPMRVILAILGLPTAHELELHRWVVGVMRMMGDPTVTDTDMIQLGRDQADFRRFTLDAIEERRRNPRGEGDFLTDLITATSDDGEPSLSNAEVFAAVLLSILAGGDTTVNLIAQLVARMLDGDGELWREAVADRTLVAAMVEEELRYDHVGRLVYRTCNVETEIGGVVIPAGAVVAVHLWSTGRDETVFESAEVFNPRRPDVSRHLGFGRGAYSCMGSALAKVETREAIEALLDGLPNARRVPGHEVRRVFSTAIQSVLDGLVVAWDVPAPASTKA